MKKAILFLALAALLLSNAIYGYRVQSRKGEEPIQPILEKMDLFLEVVQQIRSNYMVQEDVEWDRLFENAIKGMVVSLDPFSEFMTPEEYREFEKEEGDTFGGIGVQVHLQEGLLTVSSVLRDTPAAKAGILAGDQILTIEGEPQKGKKLEEIVGKLRGEPGTAVHITIQRPNEEKPLELTLVREEIENSSVSAVHVIQGTKTGFLRIDAFLEPTPQQFREALRQLLEEEIDSLIIDLRNNPGGMVKACVEILSSLLPPDSLVATLEGRDGTPTGVYKTWRVDLSLPPEIPIVVLGDRGTASAAEITISCLRDHHRAAFVGDRTFGKALVQDVMPLSGGNAVKFTVAQYYTKEHTPIQGKGIRPDFPNPLTRQQYHDLYNALGKQDEIDRRDPNIQTALEFFAQGAQWPVYQGNPDGDYEDLLPQWQRDDQRQYQMQNFRYLSPEVDDAGDDSGEEGEAEPQE